MAKPSNVPGRNPAGASLDPPPSRPAVIARSPQERPGILLGHAGPQASCSPPSAWSSDIISVRLAFRQRRELRPACCSRLRSSSSKRACREISLRRLIGAVRWIDSGNSGRLSDFADLHAHHDAGKHAVVFQPRRFSGDDLHRHGAGRKQGRHAQPAGLRRRFRQRAQYEAFLQSARYQRHHRRPRWRHRRRAVSRRHDDHSALRPARAATGGRFGRPAEAPARPPRTRSAAAHPEDAASWTCRSPTTISRISPTWI